jgi:hypothetical protein
MRHVQYVEIVSLQVADIVAIAGFAYDVHPAALPRWERTIATCAAKPSNHRQIRQRHVCLLIQTMFSCIRDSHIPD